VNGFQWIALTAIAAAIVWEFVPRRHTLSLRVRALRLAILAAAAGAIARPDDITRIAHAVGIGRGADIILYVLALAFVALAFYFYTQQLRLRRDLSALASQMALKEAKRGGQRLPGGRSAGERVS
jgi:small membrane protein